MEEPKLSASQLKEREETLKRGYAFEEMRNTTGWKLVEAYFQNQVQSYTNESLTENTDIESLHLRRQKLMGIRELFGHIDSDIRVLNQHREESSKKPTTK